MNSNNPKGLKFSRPGRGFTLIELMIVVGIIGILAAIAIPKFSDTVRKAREGALKGNLGALRSALNIYYADMDGADPYDLTPLTVNSKYLAQFWILRVPDYHTTYNLATPICWDNMSYAGQDTNGTYKMLNVSTAEADPYMCWGYQYSWSASDPSPPSSGEVYIPCSHTDTKGIAWSNY